MRRFSDEVLENYKKSSYPIRNALPVSLRKMKLDIDPTALFDVQIKRLPCLQRQLPAKSCILLDRYLTLKENPRLTLLNGSSFLGLGSAKLPLCRSVIKIINELANLVNNGPAIGDKIKIVFVKTYMGFP